MQFGALGSTVHGPEVTVNLSVFGGGDGGSDGDGGGDGGGGGGGGGGDDECEHTRQPRAVHNLPEDHWIVPGPKMKLEGPDDIVNPVNPPDG